jgi:hypothetical protein
LGAVDLPFGKAHRGVLVVSANIALHALGACTSYESAYEKGVYNYEPIYCYQTIGGVDCRREPDRRDAARLVNYYGPAPSKYDPSRPPKESALRPPPDAKADHVLANSPTTPAGAGPAKTDAAAGDGGASSNGSPEWKEWLPFVSVAFGALQLAAAFLF